MKISKFKKALTDFNVKYQQSISLDLSGARRYRIYNAISGDTLAVIHKFHQFDLQLTDAFYFTYQQEQQEVLYNLFTSLASTRIENRHDQDVDDQKDQSDQRDETLKQAYINEKLNGNNADKHFDEDADNSPVSTNQASGDNDKFLNSLLDDSTDESESPDIADFAHKLFEQRVTNSACDHDDLTKARHKYSDLANDLKKTDEDAIEAFTKLVEKVKHYHHLSDSDDESGSSKKKHLSPFDQLTK